MHRLLEILRPAAAALSRTQAAANADAMSPGSRALGVASGAAKLSFTQEAAFTLVRAIPRHFNLIDGTFDVGGLQDELTEQLTVTPAQLASVLSEADAWRAIRADLQALFPGARELCQVDLPVLPPGQAQSIIKAAYEVPQVTSIRIEQYNLDFSRIQSQRRAGMQARMLKVYVKCRANVQGLFILPFRAAVELHPLPNREVPGVTVGQLAADGGIARSYVLGSEGATIPDELRLLT